jgi:hypothetical protein
VLIIDYFVIRPISERGLAVGSQTNFYMDEITQKRFLDFVVENGGELWCDGWNNKHAWDNPYKVKLEESIDKLNEYHKLWLYKPSFGELKFGVIEKLGESISGTFEPMIELCKTYIVPEEKRLSRGRIWVQLSFWNNDNQLVYKPEELKKWYQSLNRWIRRNLLTIETGKHERTGFIYKELVSPQIKRLIDSEGYNLIG